MSDSGPATEAAPDVFFQLYGTLPRAGPGDAASTRCALDLVADLPEAPRILDVGCGPGAQTLTIARSFAAARITAVDLHVPFLHRLRAAATADATRVTCLAADMARLPFAAGSFDLIWCEGAIYFMGIARALGAWSALLRDGGSVAFSDATWRREPPEEVRRWWADEGAVVRTPEALVAEVEAAGFAVQGHFELPESAWWDDYYEPLSRRADELAARLEDDAAAQDVIAGARREVDMFRRHADCYTYTFVVARPHPGKNGESEP